VVGKTPRFCPELNPAAEAVDVGHEILGEVLRKPF